MNSRNLGGDLWEPPNEEQAQQFFEYSSEYDEKRCLAQFDRVAGAAKAHAVEAISARMIGSLLREKIDQREPASFVRLGDADGNALFHMLGKYPALDDYNMRRISKIYFGSEQLMLDHAEFFSQAVLHSLETADVIGAPVRGTVEVSFNIEPSKLDVRGMCGMRGVYNYLDERFELKKLSNAVWGSTWFPRHLREQYGDLFANLDYLGVISCYQNLGALWGKRANIKRIENHMVPMQASIARDLKKDIGHYPAAYPKILESIRPPHRGAVYIVAAGILSKPYCTMIKKRGGIGIDVGSVADLWLGTKSRPGFSDDMIDAWRLT